MHRWLFKVNLPHVFPCVGNIFILQTLVLRDIHTALQHPGKKKNQSHFLKKSKDKITQNKAKKKKMKTTSFVGLNTVFLLRKVTFKSGKIFFVFLPSVSGWDLLVPPPLWADVNRCDEQKVTRKRKQNHKRLVLVPSLLLDVTVRGAWWGVCQMPCRSEPLNYTAKSFTSSRWQETMTHTCLYVWYTSLSIYRIIFLPSHLNESVI